MRPQDLTLKILELEANHGFVLPKGLYCSLNFDPTVSPMPDTMRVLNGVDYWWFMKELDADNHNTPMPHKWAERICAFELLKLIQPRCPELRTSVDGDWIMEVDHSVPSPAVHWDREPAEMIINAVHAYYTKNGDKLKGYVVSYPNGSVL